MTKNKYKAIFCDLGNVLINFDHRIAVKKILRLMPKNEHDVYQLFFDSGFTKDYEEGKISSIEFFKKVKNSLELDMEYEEFLPIWNDIFFEEPLNKEIQNFLMAIKGNYKLVMISNINEAHCEFLKKKMPIFFEFDKLVLSYEVGFRKPAKEIYNAALKSVNVASSKAFYVDDRADLIEAASKFGIEGMTFNGEEAFKKIVEELEP
ncbi:MAG: HAD-IA family hydrolase [Candidatus Omnitrophica bacterium]|nr:HAD-IA family hydrolase [Candidatus Omnitrophota bacterium]